MIRFGLLTYKAEINAMPCPPDEFEVVINTLDTIAMSERLIDAAVNDIMSPLIGTYDIRSSYCQEQMAHVVRFTRFKRQPDKCHVHDTILRKMNRQ